MKDPNSLIGLMGLTDRDITVIKSIIKILQLSAKSSQTYRLVGSDQLGMAHIVFVDGDDPEALADWHKLADSNPAAIPIVISSSGEVIEGATTVTRPLLMNRLMAALETVTLTSTTVSQKRAPSGSMKVLVVDDSFPVRKFMEQKLPQLYSESLAMDFAVSGEEAIEKIDKANYDLIFLDVVMPGIDGYKVCKRIKSAQSVFVVMLTSKKTPFDKVRGAMSGCDAYVTKPPTDERLRKVIDDCVKKSNAVADKNMHTPQFA